MRPKTTLAILLILLPAIPFPAFSLTPEQCRVATESCMSKCPGLWPPTAAQECYDKCNSKLSGPCAGIGASGANATNKGPAGPTKGTHPIVGVPPSNAGTNKGPSGPTPTKGTHPVSVSPPVSAGTNKGTTGGGTTTIEKSGGGK